jgi:eukaryotic-like serine/threonine-protein kinase
MKICAVCNKLLNESMNHCPYDGGILEYDPLINKTIDGQYLIEARVGRGGMGAVYRAKHIPTDETRAIKVLLPEVCSVPGIRERFFREGKAAQRIQHPNVVAVYDITTESNGFTYMAMEFIKGHLLSDEAKRKSKFSAVKAFILLEPIADVLSVAHAMGVIHRDLKPENIMISKAEDGQLIVKLLDLGIAKLNSSTNSLPGAQERLTKPGQTLGTPFYMSPEQWGEAPRDAKEGKYEIDGRADIYSLGIIFYELIAGNRPYQGPSLMNLATQHIMSTPTPLHELAPDVPEAFASVIARAMAKDRNDRQSTADEFANELRTALGMATTTYSGAAVQAAKASESKEESTTDDTKHDRSSIDRLVDGVRNLFRRG